MKTQSWSTRLSVLALVAAFLSLGAVPQDAEAKRMGSGGSIGRSAPSQFQKSPPTSPSTAPSTAPSKQQAAPSNTAANPAAAAPRNRFLGPLAGLAAGLGLAALFSHLGFGAGMAEFLGTLLMVAALVFAVVFLVRMLRGQQANKARPAYSTPMPSPASAPAPVQSSNNTYRQAPIHDPVPGMGPARSDQAFGQSGNLNAFEAVDQGSTELVKQLPAGFDEQGFLASAKKFYITMQGLYDKGDVTGLREYCSDEVVDHLALEINARGQAANHTEVLNLEAELIGFEVDVDEQIATVAFAGMVREDRDTEATEVNELWIMSRPLAGGGWVLSGIHNL